MTTQHLNAAARQEQILDAARRLFLTKGYEATTIEDVLTAVGIAKGTLYHHFPGKEAILDAIVLRTVDAIVQRAQAAADGPQPATTRFLAVVGAARAPQEDIELAQQIRATGNLRLHVLAMTETWTRLVPILTRLVEEGAAAGELSTTDPRGSVEVILSAGLTMLDGGLFPSVDDDDTSERRQDALMHAFTLLLNPVRA
ncbi:TetR/AcrR family transcriptional regulator [Actinomyces sp. oral taxon 448]|jgi:transcriptional regulator, tetR family|uniref:TetR/AcrR family transcriptional regulator n=1 Tax=Actinomyces sp. oral taxon 448 TaxID=712124 RepID=UPI000218905A|nr:TetR/AcrR family transcriptional regulator [Actinomyces sp. oral taxon 448]EGQ74899.1 MalT family transcriptional regulator [Actinomyces sp. oral taxon 448 str. F0400]